MACGWTIKVAWFSCSGVIDHLDYSFMRYEDLADSLRRQVVDSFDILVETELEGYVKSIVRSSIRLQL